MSSLLASEKPYLTTDDLAKTWGISTATVRSMNKQKQLPGAFYVGRQLRFDKQKIAEWIAQGGSRAAA